jgi:hypothetical protein
MIFKSKVLITVLAVLFVFASCKKSNSTSSNNNNSNNNNSNTNNDSTAYTYYYQATINDTVYKQTCTATNNYIPGSSLDGGGPSASFSADIAPDADSIPLNETAFGITKGVYLDYTDVTDSSFKAFFSPGVYPFAASFGASGITIGWTDKAGVDWESNNAPGTQTGSNFTITKVENTTGASYNGTYYITVTATFNCTLYDGNGNSRTVTNGTFVGIFGEI